MAFGTAERRPPFGRSTGAFAGDGEPGESGSAGTGPVQPFLFHFARSFSVEAAAYFVHHVQATWLVSCGSRSGHLGFGFRPSLLMSKLLTAKALPFICFPGPAGALGGNGFDPQTH
jgi:hypothetical protein